MMKDPLVSARADAKIRAAEASYSDLVGYRFHLRSVAEYAALLASEGFEDVRLRERFVEPGLRETARNLGGWREIYRLSMATLKLMTASPLLRRKFLQAGWVKNTLIRNRSTATFIFQGLITAKKPA